MFYIPFEFSPHAEHGTENNIRILTSTLDCQKSHIVIPIRLFQANPDGSGHNILLILDNRNSSGTLFDPSGESHPSIVTWLETTLTEYRRKQDRDQYERVKDQLGTTVYPFGYLLSIDKHEFTKWASFFQLSPTEPRLRQRIFRILDRAGLLSDAPPNWDHVRITDSGNSCPLQSSKTDLYCVGWSMYLSILYLLNSIPLNEIVEKLYRLGPDGIRVIIPRFLMYLNPDLIEVGLTLPSFSDTTKSN